MIWTPLSRFSFSSGAAIPIHVIVAEEFESWSAQQDPRWQHWMTANNFLGKPESFCLLPDECGAIAAVVAGIKTPGIWAVASLALKLPPGEYRLAIDEAPEVEAEMALGFALAQYRFSRYLSNDKSVPMLKISESFYLDHIADRLAAMFLIRDLINTPSQDLGPVAFADYMRSIADRFQAQFTEIVDPDRIAQEFPAVFAVGAGSVQAPRMLRIQWGDPGHRKLALVGKGVCFDTGGYDIKPPSNMKLMKKDMGGAAVALGLAFYIMAKRLPYYLDLWIPAVDNAVSGSAYRPGDVLKTRAGKTVEVGNTDCEGRLVLADAIAAACEHKPDLLIDLATLTGAARVALGTDLPMFFSNDLSLTAALNRASEQAADPIWQLPLFEDYRRQNDSKIADLNNEPSSGYGGAITAALFLQEFVKVPKWAHFDIMAWNLSAKPGRPEGGEASAFRALCQFLENYHRS